MQFEAGQSVCYSWFLDFILWILGENHLLHEVVIFTQTSWVKSVTSYSCWFGLKVFVRHFVRLPRIPGSSAWQLQEDRDGRNNTPAFVVFTVNGTCQCPFSVLGEIFSAVFSKRWNLQGHYHNGRDWNPLVRHNS